MHRAPRRQFDRIGNQRTDTGGGDAGGQVRCHGRKDVAAMEGGADIREKQLCVCDMADFRPGEIEQVAEDAVVRADEAMVRGRDENGTARCAHAGIDYGDMDGPGWEIGPALGEREARLAQLVALDFMGDVDDAGAGRDSGDDAFHHAYEMVLQTEIRQQGNQGRGRARRHGLIN